MGITRLLAQHFRNKEDCRFFWKKPTPFWQKLNKRSMIWNDRYAAQEPLPLCITKYKKYGVVIARSTVIFTNVITNKSSIQTAITNG
jgi:hypothetical protein